MVKNILTLTPRRPLLGRAHRDPRELRGGGGPHAVLRRQEEELDLLPAVHANLQSGPPRGPTFCPHPPLILGSRLRMSPTTTPKGASPSASFGNDAGRKTSAKTRQSEQGALKRGGIDLLVMPSKLKGRLPLWRVCSVGRLRRLVKRRNLHPLCDLVDEVVGLFPA